MSETLISIEKASKSFGEKILFDEIDLKINRGNKIALIAKNGTGKTTLLHILVGKEKVEGEQAKYEQAKNLRIGYLPQEPELPLDVTVFDVLLDADNPQIRALKSYKKAQIADDAKALQSALEKMDDTKAWDVEARLHEVLYQLKVSNESAIIGSLSGGQQKRVALAKLILENYELMVLDEPTNHLDIDMIEWLESYLTSSAITLFVVTHDRYFLNNVCNAMIELEHGELKRYTGDYEAYLEKKEIEQQNSNVVHDKNVKKYLKELDWVRRMPKARGTKAKSRIQAFQEIKAEVKSFKKQEELEFNFKPDRLGGKIIEFHNVGFAYGDKKILENFSYKFKKNDRVGIVGPNGAGKSTFLKLLTKEIAPHSGKVIHGETLNIAYFKQEGLVHKHEDTVLDVVRNIADYVPMEKGLKMTAERLLEKFMFPRDQQRVKARKLSGGEKKRLLLLTILMKNPNFLILDEPTNDLDLPTLQVLEQFLLEFKANVLIVSHDRFFLDKVVDHLFVMDGKGHIKDFNGFYSEYRNVVKEMSDAEKVEGDPLPEASPAVEKKVDYQKSKEDKNRLRKVEREMEKYEEQKKELNAYFLSPELNPEDIAKYGKQLEEVNTKLEDLEEEWLELVDRIG